MKELAYEREIYLITSQMLREYHKSRMDNNEDSSIKKYTIFCNKHRLWKRLEYLNGD